MQITKGDKSFTYKAAAAMTISLAADALDYFAAPLFDVPVIGDVFDVITTSLLYSITKSKVSTAMNTIELIPVIGDFVPTYTLSTLLWILRELKKRNKLKKSPITKIMRVVDS
jgi:amino acid transporter